MNGFKSRNTHYTAADVNAMCVSTAEGTRIGLHEHPPGPRSNFHVPA